MQTENIITLIIEDHRPLKAGIKVLTAENERESTKKKALKTFLRDLKLHSKAEEQSLYANEEGNKDIRPEILEGYEEHEVADALALELEASNFETNWTDQIEAKAKVLAELVKHHVQEEENDLLPDTKKSLSPDELVRLGGIYKKRYAALVKELSVDTVPAAIMKSAAPREAKTNKDMRS